MAALSASRKWGVERTDSTLAPYRRPSAAPAQDLVDAEPGFGLLAQLSDELLIPQCFRADG